MIKHYLSGSTALLTALLLAGCSMITAKPGAEEIRVLGEDRVSECESLGSVKVSVLDRVMGLDRHEEDVEDNLETLARNHAIEKDGDTISPLGPIEDGERRFGVYRCVDADTSAKSDSGDGDEEEDEGVVSRGYERN